MKTILILITAISFTGCANFPPVKGKVCYQDAKGNSVCVGSDGKAVIVEGSISGQTK